MEFADSLDEFTDDKQRDRLKRGEQAGAKLFMVSSAYPHRRGAR
jgi:hypothetical protein